MKKLLLFGGTSEEHELLKVLAVYPIVITLCVVSEYGWALLPPESDKLSVRIGRMDAKQMMAMIREEGFSFVVDATHPYATEVSANIRAAASETNIPYLRLLREKSDTGNSIIVPSIQAAAEMLKELQGAALITTGSKELAVFTQVPAFEERLYLRVLPTVESIKACLTIGFAASHIIAMQGPFSKALNIALMQQFAIKTLVTKDGGKFGGFPEKLAAAKELDVDMIVISRPNEKGFTQTEIVQRLFELLEGERWI